MAAAGPALREASMRNLEAAGHPAMSYLAEFTQKEGVVGREYMLRVVGNEAKGQFLVSCLQSRTSMPERDRRSGCHAPLALRNLETRMPGDRRHL